MALYAPIPATPVATTAALVSGKVVSATNGTHYTTTIQIDASAPTAIYYLQSIQGNGATVPADGALPAGVTFLHTPLAWSHTSGTPDAFSIDDGDGGAKFAGGLCFVLSSTQFTKTAAAYMLSDSSVQ